MADLTNDDLVNMLALGSDMASQERKSSSKPRSSWSMSKSRSMTNLRTLTMVMCLTHTHCPISSDDLAGLRSGMLKFKGSVL